jgi:hypothetical protein
VAKTIRKGRTASSDLILDSNTDKSIRPPAPLPHFRSCPLLARSLLVSINSCKIPDRPQGIDFSLQASVPVILIYVPGINYYPAFSATTSRCIFSRKGDSRRNNSAHTSPPRYLHTPQIHTTAQNKQRWPKNPRDMASRPT